MCYLRWRFQKFAFWEINYGEKNKQIQKRFLLIHAHQFTNKLLGIPAFLPDIKEITATVALVNSLVHQTKEI